MLTQAEGDALIFELKERVKNEYFVWKNNTAQNELIVAVGDDTLRFILSLKKNPHEIKLHLRTKKKDIGLLRIDNAPYHSNPDGEEIRGPHMHYYVAGEELGYAELIDWYDLNDPVTTLLRFLDEARIKYFEVQLEIF